MKRRIIYLPVEVKVRDLYPRLLFAAFAAERGYDVILGSDRVLKQSWNKVPGGLVIDKSLAANKREWILALVQGNFGYAAEDAETLGFYRKSRRDWYVRTRIEEDLLKSSTRYFCWGRKQEELVRSIHPYGSNKLKVTGSFRFDILKEPFRSFFREPLPEGVAPRGPYVLFNSNFGRIHHLQGRDYPLTQFRDFGGIRSQEDEEEWVRSVHYQDDMVLKVQDFLFAFRERFPEHEIIVRPHPVEDFRYWRYLLRRLPRSRVVYEGSVLNWILHADLVLHHGCTTGVEAVVAEVPTLALFGSMVNPANQEISNQLCESSADLDSSLSLAEKLLGLKGSPYRLPDDMMDPFNAHVDSLSETFASERILEELDHLHWEKDVLQGGLPEGVGKKASESRPRYHHTISPTLHARKLTRIGEDEIEAPLRWWKHSGHFPSVDTVKPIGDSVFLIRSTDKEKEI